MFFLHPVSRVARTNRMSYIQQRGTVKVDQARKRGNISIVSQNWLTDSIAQWRRMDEKPYLLEEPTVPLAPVPVTSSNASVADESEMKKDLELGDVDWDAINNEVDEAMNESDDDEDSTYIGNGVDDDTRSERSVDDFTDGSVKSDRYVNVSFALSFSSRKATKLDADDDLPLMYWNSNSANNSPRLKRKRLRSLTPSESRPGQDELLKSPLSKRKKLTNDRSGLSKLKEGITASDMDEDKAGDWSRPAEPESPTAWYMKTDDGDGEDDDDDDEDEDESIDDDDEDGSSEVDDFLARELEEEWG